MLTLVVNVKRMVKLLRQEDLVTSLAFHPNGDNLVSGSADGIVKLWNLPMIHRELTSLGLGW